RRHPASRRSIECPIPHSPMVGALLATERRCSGQYLTAVTVRQLPRAGFPDWWLIGADRPYKVILSVGRPHTIGPLSYRATVARWTRARSRSRLVSGGTGEARTKGGDRVCSDNQGRLA